MRSFLLFLGSLLLLGMVLGGLGLLYGTYKGSQLDRDSRTFVDNAVREITSQWNEQALVDRAAPELLQSIGPGALERMFGRFRQLGAMRSYEGASGDASITLTRHGINVSALYFAQASFDAGDATIRMTLSRRDGQWRILNFRVDSEALTAARPAPAAPAASAATAGASRRDADLDAYGPGAEGFNRWCKASLSAISVRYQSATEIWIAMSDTYGPYPTRALAARAGAKYLVFDTSVPFVKIILFRSNQRVAEAVVNRE